MKRFLKDIKNYRIGVTEFALYCQIIAASFAVVGLWIIIIHHSCR